MPRFLFCPLSFDNLTCNLPDDVCLNWCFCRNQVAAWSLPYEYFQDLESFPVLVVKSIATYTYASHCSSHPAVSSNFSSELNQIIQASWLEAGWMAAHSSDPFPF